jgi:hypothetical protein
LEEHEEQMMLTDADKLRFEVGEGFNILSPSEIKRNEERFEKELREQEENNGHSECGPYYEATLKWALYIHHKYFKKPEAFINAIIAHDDWNTFGWALKTIQDTIDVHRYALIYIEKHLSSSGFNKEGIKIILEEMLLPC